MRRSYCPTTGSGAVRGFTLIELLVVIGIIALLIAILLPSLVKARQSGMRVKCMSNARQLMNALVLYTHDHKGIFPFHKDTAPGPNGATAGNVGWSGNGLNPFAVEVNPYWNTNMPTYLAKYLNVKTVDVPSSTNADFVSPQIAHCPSNSEAQFRGNNTQRTSYWYSATMYLTPEDLRYQFDNGGSFAKADHNPVKISWAKHAAQKILLQELESFHENKRLNSQQARALTTENGNRYRYVCGFADGHVDSIQAGDFVETNINITGKTITSTGTLKASREFGVGIRGVDVY